MFESNPSLVKKKHKTKRKYSNKFNKCFVINNSFFPKY